MAEVRVLNSIVTEVCKRALNEGKTPAVIYEAPTGYGKTTSSIAFYSTLAEYKTASGLIHVLPMRSIAVELYCKIVNALGESDERCREFGSDEVIAEFVRKSGILRADVGYQFMDFIDQSKSPFFLKTLLITTFNSFFHNLSRFPVGELRKYRKHYEVPRAAIFTSGVVFDEAHLYGGDPGAGDESSLTTAFVVSVRALADAHVPMLIESATLPDVFRDLLGRILVDAGLTPRLVSFRYGSRKCGQECLSCGEVECYDEEYVSTCSNVKWATKVIDEERVIDIVREHVGLGHKVLVVRNTVEKAVRTYRELESSLGGVELIHGRFTKRDRVSKLLSCRSSKVVVSTQVIEAGVNLSFDVLVTDSASPSSVVQRTGRIARGCRVSDAYVYVAKSSGDGVYNEKVVELFMNKLIELLQLGHEVEWRIPSRSFVLGRVSFLKLVNESYQGVELELDPRKYVGFLDLVSCPVGTVSHGDLVKTYERFGGLLRTSLLIPVYVGDMFPKDLSELYEFSVPLSPEFVRRYSSSLLRFGSNGDKVLVITLKCSEDLSRCELSKNSVNRSLLNDYTRLLMFGWSGGDYVEFPLSFWAKPGAYSEEVGLVLEV